ncbi:MAG: arginine--tRNA ligase, partial [Clostridia bacterium]|nr:arginine--tRNA ligase [Clostridia bacterium]
EIFHWFKDVTLKDAMRVYDILDVHFDSYAGESFYNDKMDRVIDELNEKGLLVESDGAKIVDLEEYGMHPCLILKKDEALEKEIDAIVTIIGKAQAKDGYLNTYFTLKEPGKRWTNLVDCHELYCFGHLAEGAVAYHQATGKTEFLDIMCREADHIRTVIGPEEGKLHGYPGHPEAELALWRLYLETGKTEYLDLSRYFIDQRGTEPNFFREEWERRGHVNHWTGHPASLNLSYHQAHMPVREQREAVGHAVRALYLYAGMAAVAAETKDESLLSACEKLWDSAVNRKMYVTGGLGATVHGEAFMTDYELPNDTAYAETCASVALCFFAKALNLSRLDGRIDDAVEREVFNVISAGESLSMDRFFYVNPLEAVQGVSGKEPGLTHALPARPKWFACACCPPNVARLFTSLAAYSAEENERGIILRQYLDGTYAFEKAEITLKTQYPWEGDLRYTIDAHTDTDIYLRMPGWADPTETALKADGETLTVRPERGYVRVRMKKGLHSVLLSLPMKPRRLYASPRVRADAGCVAFAYGPMIYCLEGCDNPEPLWNLMADGSAPIEMTERLPDVLGGIRQMKIPGFRRADKQEALYAEEKPRYEKTTLTAIPYYAWANREAKDMRVWVREG